jgi:hypothetical protein
MPTRPRHRAADVVPITYPPTPSPPPVRRRRPHTGIRVADVLHLGADMSPMVADVNPPFFIFKFSFKFKFVLDLDLVII